MQTNSRHYPFYICIDYFGSDNSKFIDELITKLQSFPYGETSILHAYEWKDFNHLIEIINQIKLRLPDQKIIWILPESIYFLQKQVLADTGIVFYLMDTDILNLYFELDLYKSCDISKVWNDNAEKFLFLTGKPNKKNRIQLMHKLYKKGLLDKAVWSLFVNESLRRSCRHLLSELTDAEYNEFLDTHIGSPDKIEPTYGRQSSVHYDGYPYDCSLYENTLFRLVSETQMFDVPLLTEKTWVTIINNQPFLIAGFPGSLDFLIYAGFKTFQEYLPYPNYDSEVDDSVRYSQVISNTAYLLDNAVDAKSNIHADVKHNYELLRGIMNRYHSYINCIHEQINFPGSKPFQIIPQPSKRAHWINFYYSIKAPHWPDCYVEEHFKFLPEHIRNECVDNFGYKEK